jgi:hypothetical protein
MQPSTPDMKDLGESYEKTVPMPEPSTDNSKKKTYPKLCLRDKTLAAVFGKDLPKVGTEIEGEIMLKVTGIRDDEYGKSVDFDVVSMELEGAESEEDSEEDGQES